MDLVNIVTFLWLAWWAFVAVRELAKGTRDSVLYLIPVYFVYCGVPLLLDVVAGIPEYLLQPGYQLAVQDERTSLIYCAFVAAVPVFWYRWGRVRRVTNWPDLGSTQLAETSTIDHLLRRARPLLQIAAWAPVAAWLFAPNPSAFLEYGAAPVQMLESGAELTEDASYYINVISRVSLLAVVAIGALMLSQRKRFLINLFLYFGPLLITAVWLNSKRTSVVLAVVVLLFALWYRGMLRGTKLYVVGALAILLIGAFSQYYQTGVRDAYAEADSSRIYRGIRVDYGRDSRIKMAIYAELYPEEMQILDYRGQTVLYYAGLAIPREVWPEKPLPYAQYFTAAMQLRPAEMQHGSMTTSWLDEAIANFGWGGLFIGPFVFALICRVGDKRQSGIVSLLTGLVAILFLSVELIAFFPIVAIWVGVMALPARSRADAANAPVDLEGYQPESLA